MIETKKYLANTLRLTGVAFCSPLLSMFFQVLVFGQHYGETDYIAPAILSVAGLVIISFGYNVIKAEEQPGKTKDTK